MNNRNVVQYFAEKMEEQLRANDDKTGWLKVNSFDLKAGIDKNVSELLKLFGTENTDDIVRRSKRRLDEKYGLYRGVIVDIFYDHYLAKNWSRYSDVPLQEYTHEFYTILQNNTDILPDRIKFLMKYMMLHYLMQANNLTM